MGLTRRNPESSDYVRQMTGGPTGSTSHANDTTMEPKHNAVSDAFNWAVTNGMDMLGYDTRERTGLDNNDFYRNYAQYMPGYNIDGIPSGAWAQNAATNHVGTGTGPGNPWDNVRRSLVEQESGMIEDRMARGEDPNLSYWDLYDAHYEAYNTSGGGGNQFIDPGSFALAVYGAPLLEAVGIDSGPITGASIDLFNDPTDSATEGWAKRMALNGGEMGAGALMMSNPLTFLPGAAMFGLGAFGAAYNTASAVFDGGMLGEWGDAISDGAGAVWDGATGLASDAGGAISDGAEYLWDGAAGLAGDAGDLAGEVWDGAGGLVSDAGSAIGSLFSW